MEAPPQVSVIIVHYNHAQDTRNLLRGLLDHVDHHVAEYLIVVNGREGDPPSQLPDSEKIRLIQLDENLGYGSACNRGVDNSRAPFLLVLNNDILVESDFLGPLLHALRSEPNLGIVSPLLRFPDGTFQVSTGRDPSPLSDAWEKIRQHQSRRRSGFLYRAAEKHFGKRQDVDWVTGAAMLIRAQAHQAIDGFDEEFFMYFEDSDYCRRMRKAGYRVCLLPDSTLIHLLGGAGLTASPEIKAAFRRSQLRYYEKHGSLLARIILRFYLSVKFFILPHRNQHPQ